MIITLIGLLGCGADAAWSSGSSSDYYGAGADSSGGGYSGGTPSSRPHDIVKSEDGTTGRHAQGYSTPFLCLDSAGSSVTCPDDAWPDTSELSCDASGCHGSYTYEPGGTRDLSGSAGPSCYDCHGQEWSGSTTAGGGGSSGGGWDEDD